MKFRWIEHLNQAFEAFIEDLTSFVPEKSRTHLKNAKKEMLLALKELIEKKIEELEKPRKEVKKVKVEAEE